MKYKVVMNDFSFVIEYDVGQRQGVVVVSEAAVRSLYPDVKTNLDALVAIDEHIEDFIPCD